MIVVDTSVLMEIALVGPRAERCGKALDEAAEIVISAATLSEALIVAWGKRIDGLPASVQALLAAVPFEIVSVDEGTARRVGDAYARWGKGSGSNVLNWGDCFAYALAIERDLPLLYIGNDFAKTDVRCALPLP